jgi:hypothetical protein
LYENPRFQASFSSTSSPTWNPPPQYGRALVAAGNVGRPKAPFGPGAKNAGLKLGVPAVMIGQTPTESRSVNRNEAIGLIPRIETFA